MFINPPIFFLTNLGNAFVVLGENALVVYKCANKQNSFDYTYEIQNLPHKLSIVL
jgi:hypothetical protein